MTDADRKLFQLLAAEGYYAICRLPSGKVAGIHRQLYTFSLCDGLTAEGISRRFCYEHERDAVSAIASWDGVSDPPGPWIKEKSTRSERLGPGATGKESTQ